jgi:hypothetical protein
MTRCRGWFVTARGGRILRVLATERSRRWTIWLAVGPQELDACILQALDHDHAHPLEKLIA